MSVTSPEPPGGLDRVGRWAGGLARLSVDRPRTVLSLATVLALAALALAAGRLELRTSNLDLIDPELPEVARYLELVEEFGTPNVLVVVVESAIEEAEPDDPLLRQYARDEVRRAIDLLGPRLRGVAGVRAVLDHPPFSRAALDIAGIDPYLCSRDGAMCFLFVQPADGRSQAATLAPFVRAVRSTLDDTLEEMAGGAARLSQLPIRAGLTGMPAYALDDRELIGRDISRLSVLGGVLVVLFFSWAFGGLRRPLLAGLALLPAVALTIGFAALAPGYLTLLSSFFASILMGLGIDSGIHLIDRVEELLTDGWDERRAIPRAAEALGRSLATSALTSAGVLFTLRFAGFRGFAELGTIAAVGVLLALLAMLSILPALLALTAGRSLAAGRAVRRGRSRWARVLARPWLAAVLVLAALLGAVLGEPGFDSDYLNLQPRRSEAVRLEREMLRRSDFSPELLVFAVETRQELADLLWLLADDETVAAVRSIRDLELLGGVAVEASETSGDEASAMLAWRRQFVSASGRLAVYAHPAGDIWQPDTQRELLARMRAIDPRVSGMPVLGHFMVERSRRALRLAAGLGTVVLLVLLLLDFRDPRWALLAATPALLTLGLVAGVMDLVGLAFNPLDIMALPLVLGLAVDDGVHLVHRFRAEGGDLDRALAGTGRAVVLTSLTTALAFGALALTHHRGLASFAQVLTLGVVTALVLSLGVLPVLLRWVSKSRHFRLPREIGRAADQSSAVAPSSHEGSWSGSGRPVRSWWGR